LIQKALETVARQKVSMDQFITTALAVQISAARHPGIADRARRVDWDKVDKILARVPDVPPLPGDER
jgi:hypothetical protein